LVLLHGQKPSTTLWIKHTIFNLYPKCPLLLPVEEVGRGKVRFNAVKWRAKVSQVRSEIILSIPVTLLVPFPLLNPNWSSQNTSLIFFSFLLLRILATIFAAYAMRLIVQWSPYFVATGFFSMTITVTSKKTLVHSPVSFTLLISYAISWKSSSPNSTYIIISCRVLIPPRVDSFPLHCARCKSIFRLCLLPLQFRLLGFLVSKVDHTAL